jgi:hypothetical protein
MDRGQQQHHSHLFTLRLRYFIAVLLTLAAGNDNQ